jgi:hypothetical protein
MARQKKRSVKGEYWSLPDVAEVDAALDYFFAREQKQVRKTLPFVIHKPSGWKRRYLVDSLDFRDDLVERILAEWKEDYTHLRGDGALALILGMQDNSLFKSRTLANEIRKRFPQEPQSLFLSRFYESCTRDAAQMITRWAQDKIRRATKTIFEREKAQANEESKERPKKARAPALEEVYAIWREDEEEYKRVASRLIEFGRNAGDTLKQHGKREARWLLDRLLPINELEELLVDLDTMLDDEERLLDGEADLVEHPWMLVDAATQDSVKHQRAVRESRLLQRVFDPSGDLALLGTLHKSELQDLRRQLAEMKAISTATREAMLSLHGAVAETVAASEEQSQLQRDLELFLLKRPAGYPSVTRVVWTAPVREQIRDTYERWMRWFEPDKNKPQSLERWMNEIEEENTTEGMWQTARKLLPPRRQVLSLIGTARPGQNRDFALLFDRKSMQLTIAIMLYEPGAFGTDGDATTRAVEHPSRQQQQHQYQERREIRPLFYVNFPHIPFAPRPGPRGLQPSVLYLPLQYDGAYHRGLVEKLVARQTKFVKQGGDNIDLDTLPPAFAKSAKLFCEWDEEGRPSFSVNISFQYDTFRRRARPQRVIGFHERDGRYFYAVVELDGKLVASGEIRSDPHVDPQRGAKPNTDNYVYALAQAMVAKAQMWEAYIGIEDTSWKKNEVSLSRSKNRRIFLNPIKVVMKKLEEATCNQGMLSPFIVSNVSPVRDCGACSTRMPEEEGRSEVGRVVRCPVCKVWQQYVADGLEDQSADAKQGDIEDQQCKLCHHQWKPVLSTIREERVFFCNACGAGHQPEWHNTALVVARRTLGGLVKYHKGARAAEAKRLEKQRAKQVDRVGQEDLEE